MISSTNELGETQILSDKDGYFKWLYKISKKDGYIELKVELKSLNNRCPPSFSCTVFSRAEAFKLINFHLAYLLEHLNTTFDVVNCKSCDICYKTEYELKDDEIEISCDNENELFICDICKYTNN